MTATAARTTLAARIAAVAGAEVCELTRFAGGHGTRLWRVALADGRRWVAKAGPAGSGLALEGGMLAHLAAHSTLPVPAVHSAADDLLLIDEIRDDGVISAAVEREAAVHLAALHDRTMPGYGFAWDTRIGPLAQPNPETDDWIAFFRDHRLLWMARAALDEGRLEPALMARIERLAGRLDQLIGAPAPPALIHGDLWGGNLLAHRGRLAGVIDPAIYHADPEIELAFTTLFGTFGPAFFDHYQARRPLRPGFFEVRRDLYNLYPLLVHVRLFGGSYHAAVVRVVDRFVST